MDQNNKKIIISELIYYHDKDFYKRLFNSFVNSEITSEEFENQFLLLLDKNIEKCKALNIEEFSRGSLGFILFEIVTACNLSDNSDRNEKNLQSFIQDISPIFNQICDEIENW